MIVLAPGTRYIMFFWGGEGGEGGRGGRRFLDRTNQVLILDVILSDGSNPKKKSFQSCGSAICVFLRLLLLLTSSFVRMVLFFFFWPAQNWVEFSCHLYAHLGDKDVERGIFWGRLFVQNMLILPKKKKAILPLLVGNVTYHHFVHYHHFAP